MDGYLVLLVHEMDDVPVGLFENLDGARTFADQLDPMPTPNVRMVFHTDCSTPVCVKVVSFKAGAPDAVVYTRDFGE